MGKGKKNFKRVYKSLHKVWDTTKKKNKLHIIRVPEREQREKGAENLFEAIMAEKF